MRLAPTRPVTWLLLLVATLLAVGCANAPAARVRALSDSGLEERARLVAAAASGRDPIAASRELLAIELRDGHVDAAHDRARLLLAQARTAWRLADLEHASSAERRRARRVAVLVSREVVAIGERLSSPELVLAAALASPEPRAHRRQAITAARQLEWVGPDLGTEALLALVGDDERAHARLAGVSMWHDEDEAAAFDDARLRASGPHAQPACNARLDDALRQGLAAAEVRPWVDAILRQDPTDIRTGLLAQVLADVAAGRVDDDPRLLADVGRTWGVPRLGRLARLRARQLAHPAGSSIALARVHHLLEADLVGDAHAVLGAVRPTSPEGKAIHAQLVARVALRRGDAAAYERWRAGVRSRGASVDRWASALDMPGTAPSLRRVAREARRRWVGSAPQPSRDELLAVWLDLSAPRVERRAAARALRTTAIDLWRIGQVCESHGLDTEACWTLQDALSEDEAGAFVPSILELSKERTIHPSWLANARWLDAASLRMLGPVVARGSGTSLEASAEFQALALRLSVARGDRDAAARVLARGGAFLEAVNRSWGHLAILDLADGADPDVLLAATPWSFAAGSDTLADPEAAVAPAPPGNASVDATRVGRLSRAFSELRADRHDRAVELFAAVLADLPPDVHPEVWVAAAHAAAVAGDRSRSDAWRARVVAARSDRPDVQWLEGWVADRDGVQGTARQRYAGALRAAPEDPRAMVAYIDLALRDAPLAAVRGLVSGSGHDNEWGRLVALGTALRHEPLPARAHLLAIAQAVRSEDGREAWSLDAGPTIHRSLATRGVEWMRTRIDDAPDPATAATLASQAADRMAADKRLARRRAERIWLLLMAGRVADALALADARAPADDWSPLEEGGSLRQLLAARKSGQLDDAATHDVWRWSRGIERPSDAGVEAIMRGAKDGPLLAFACIELSLRDDVGPARQRCRDAWERSPRSTSLAVSVSYVGLNLGDGELVARAFDGSVSVPTFEQAPELAIDDGRLAAWHQNHAAWLSERDRHDAAAEAWWQAYALGSTDTELYSFAYAQIMGRGEQVRALQSAEGDGFGAAAASRGYTALRQGEPEIADIYADLAIRATAPVDEDEREDAARRGHEVRHLAALVRADLEARRAEPAVIGEAVGAIANGDDVAKVRKLHAANPEASTTTFALAAAHVHARQHAEALALLDTLVARHPTNPWVAVVAARAREQTGDVNAARAVLAHATRAHPDDWLVAHAALSEAVSGPRAHVPAWARDPEAFSSRIDAVDDKAIADLFPRRRAEPKAASEIWLPLAATSVPERMLSVALPGDVRVFVVAEARASRCVGERCAADMRESWARDGATLLWQRPIEVGAGEATELLLSDGQELLSTFVVPSGGRTFFVGVGAPHATFAEALPVVALARRSFRPLDAVLPAFRAETLRVSTGVRVSGEARIAARHEQSRHRGSTCSIAAALADQPRDAVRAELLLDVWLASPSVEQRRALMRCADPTSPVARRIGMIALLDEDPGLHHYGRSVAAASPTRVVADAEATFSTSSETAISDPSYLTDRDLPPRALIEVLMNVPRLHAERVVARRLNGDDRDRAIAFAALRLRPELPRRETLRPLLPDLPPMWAREAARLLDDDEAPDDPGVVHEEAAPSRRGRAALPLAPLATARLAEVLPGEDWTFVRVGAPGLFATTLGKIAAGLRTGGDAASDEQLRSLLRSRLRRLGFGQLSEGGGLDASEPVECASPAGESSFVCVASVADRERLLAQLGERDFGEDAGVSMPLQLASTVGIVPVALGALPALLHPFVYSTDHDAPDERVVTSERVRSRVRVAGHDMERYAIVHVTGSRLGVDSEHYLFIGDRVWIFGLPSLARRVLEPDGETSLADSPRFRRLTASWRGGAALQAVMLGRAWELGDSASAEVALDERGITFRYAGTLDEEPRDVSIAAALLPDGAISRVAIGSRGPDSDFGWLHGEPEDEAEQRRRPPHELWRKAPALAFGWYPRSGDTLWRRWVATAPWSSTVDAALRERGVRLRREGDDTARGGLHFARVNGHAVVTSDRALLDEAIARTVPAAGDGERRRIAEFSLDSSAAVEVLRTLAVPDAETKLFLRTIAPMLGAFEDLNVHATWDPTARLAVFEGRVGLRSRGDADGSDVVDDWLAATEMPNAGRLPRRIDVDDATRPLTFVLRVPDAAAFVRDAVVASPRMRAEVLDDHHVRLQVAPDASSAPAAPLSKRARARALAGGGDLFVDHPRIVKVARRLAPVGTSPEAGAAAIVGWVHRRIRYEVTPRSLTSLEILDTGRGDCTEYARLTVSLLRAAGIPAEMRDGLAASGDEMVAHAWAAWHDGERWHEIDPTWGEPAVTAGHLELSVTNTLALISLGEIEVVEVITTGAP